MIRNRFILFVLLASISAVDLLGQHVPSKERVAADGSLRRRTEIDGNNVRTSVFNFCFSGRTGVGEGVPYEWPKNTLRYYVALVGLFVGAEVVPNNDTVGIPVIDLPTFRQSPTGASWNLEPIPGYFNLSEGKIAKSDEPKSWPAFWPDKESDAVDPGWRNDEVDNDLTRAAWNGYFGKNQFSADQEMFFRNGDDNYTRWNYSPDTTDLSRRGLGLVIDSRVMEWSQASVADAVFFIHAVKNDGTKPIKKTAVTIWLADFVGGDGDSQDDAPAYDLIADIAFSLDNDGVSTNPAFRGTFVGAAATMFLETPGIGGDRIDNDADGELGPGVGDARQIAPRITSPMLAGEVKVDGIDNNMNGLIDEDSTHVPFLQQVGVTFANRIDDNNNGEPGSPTVTSQMETEAAQDTVRVGSTSYTWRRWPPKPETDPVQNGEIHLIQVTSAAVGRMFKDNIDNDGNSTMNWPSVTNAMVTAASSDAYKRYKVPGTNVILYDVGAEDVGRKYIDVDGGRDPNIDEGIDEMVDESRDDKLDNDGDWRALTDDVGLDGAAGTNDPGEGDGLATSGAGTSFPGEPNIDKTDVSEADQIGLTNVQYEPAGAINFTTTSDIFFWVRFMLPGSFVDPALIPVGEGDLFVGSGLFPLQPGQIERISYAVVFGNAVQAGNANVSGAKDDILDPDRGKGKYAKLAYEEDYQFAQAPLEPTLTAVPGDRKVTLYWNDVAERSFDRFLAGLTGANPNDFEGYKVYRATDPAFEDARIITDAFGNPAPYLKPLATFDLVDSIFGFHPIDFNGVLFDLGKETGLVHSWVDTTVQNGQKYYYVVRAYDQGYEPLRITPAESNLRISIDNVTGKVKSLGTSVVIVVPEAPVAGYVPPIFSSAEHVSGTSSGKVSFTIVDPTKIKDNRRYRMTFEDTVISPGGLVPDTFKTKNYTLADITSLPAIDTLINRFPNISELAEQPLVDGFRLKLENEKNPRVNTVLSKWNRTGIYDYNFNLWKGGQIIGLPKPGDYRIIFGSVGTDTSTAYTIRTGGGGFRPAQVVNFKIVNTIENKPVEFAFTEFDITGGTGMFTVGSSESDEIVFLEKNTRDSLVTTWSVAMKYDTVSAQPQSGDTLTILLYKIFLPSDVFEFSTQGQKVDRTLAQKELGRIKVVPNPYIAAATWEERNPYFTGRGPRSIHFIHLPQRCTIRIYAVSGEHVATIEHESTLLDGTAEWNLLTRDNLATSYGVYVYHVDAPGIGEIIGKFAIIK